MCCAPLFFCLDRCRNVALDSQLAPSIPVPQSYKAGPQLEELRYPVGQLRAAWEWPSSTCNPQGPGPRVPRLLLPGVGQLLCLFKALTRSSPS